MTQTIFIKVSSENCISVAPKNNKILTIEKSCAIRCLQSGKEGRHRFQRRVLERSPLDDCGASSSAGILRNFGLAGHKTSQSELDWWGSSQDFEFVKITNKMTKPLWSFISSHKLLNSFELWKSHIQRLIFHKIYYPMSKLCWLLIHKLRIISTHWCVFLYNI